jgi:FkbM family methyltransferase
MTQRTIADHLVNVYGKVFPWRFRFKYGSPLIGPLMRLKGNKVSIRDYEVFLNPDDKTATELFLVHANVREWIWESYEISLFLETLKANPNSLAVDVGANYGAYSLSCCPLARDGVVRSVVAVEPNRATFACLKKSFESSGFSPYVHVVNGAAVKTHGTECLFHPHDTFSAMSKCAPDSQSQAFSSHLDPYTVRGITLDGLLPELGISDINSLVVKIDVEGGEPDVFGGMEMTLSEAQGYQVFFELHPGALLSLGHDPLALARYLFSLGLDVVGEVDHNAKIVQRIRDISDFAAVIERCMTTTEMWQDYTNIFISKDLTIPFEIQG